MLVKSIAGLIAATALGLLAGCSTPCAPGGLCAPGEANTSGQAGDHALAVPAPVREDAAIARAAPRATIRIALLLPLQSATLAEPAEAVRAGFMAAWQRQRAGFEVDLIPTGDDPQDLLAAYTQAAGQDDVIVGPLARGAVDALAASPAVTKPTIALNHPSQDGPLPAQMLVIGLSIEDEARQAAQWAASEHPGARALVLGGPAAWQQRAGAAFDDSWTGLGLSSQRLAIAHDGATTSAALEALRGRIAADPPGVLFAALDAGQLREVRAAIGTDIPCYAISSANPGRAAAVPELNGVRLLDLPWEVRPAGDWPQWSAASRTADLDRLYALGIDAWLVARETALHPGAPFTLDGVTGKLDSAGGKLQRTEAAVVYQDGAFQAAH